jgi:hypothetical protein
MKQPIGTVTQLSGFLPSGRGRPGDFLPQQRDNSLDRLKPGTRVAFSKKLEKGSLPAWSDGQASPSEAGREEKSRPIKITLVS